MDEKAVKKILDHPESDKIVGKLITGEPPKTVADYLKLKFNKTEEAHLRVSKAALEEFKDKYLDQYKALSQILKDEKDGKLDKKIADSLLTNKAWRERILETNEDEVNLKRKILDVLHKLEIRAEQVFDRIQEDPRVTKNDYIMLKYFDTFLQGLEKADKIINERPDQTIQHNVTVQLVEQHSVAFQEAIRDLLQELDPEISARFMELLTDRMKNIHQPDDLAQIGMRPLEARMSEGHKLLPILEGKLTDG